MRNCKVLECWGLGARGFPEESFDVLALRNSRLGFRGQGVFSGSAKFVQPLRFRV